jgi:hypothetical protein
MGIALNSSTEVVYLQDGLDRREVKNEQRCGHDAPGIFGKGSILIGYTNSMNRKRLG